MFVSSFIAATACLLANPGLAIPAKPVSHEAVGKWSLWGFRRLCADDETNCRYTFDIVDDNSAERESHLCSLSVDASGNLPSDETSFSSIDCSDSGDGTRFQVNGGYNVTGQFLTIVVTDVEAQQNAFFGYRQDEIGNFDIPAAKTSDVFSIGTFANTPAVSPRDVSDEEVMWQVLNMNRHWDPATQTIYLDFRIVGTDGTDQTCNVESPPTTPFGTWWAAPCGDDYSVSWGYKEDTDGGVMTICHPESGKTTWFGWDSINNREYLGNSAKAKRYIRKGCS
ncbi:hypothetical protein B0T17DRAFT_45682 [Bombardia bombarda]|uniref:Uncharacterized protein n=1 Tax=Bombardia bombarda TaxID=252184 RepID=A0AA39XKW2_9PEZI|nr:hypothetical protein B0T17DRAFT_45682 [Bombardia bombarda]